MPIPSVLANWIPTPRFSRPIAIMFTVIFFLIASPASASYGESVNTSLQTLPQEPATHQERSPEGSAPQATGNLQVFVKDQNGSYRSGAVVVRYSSSWSYIDQKTTNTSGYVYWSGIEAATYNLEVYYTDNGTQEFWGGSSAAVPSGGTQTVTIQRHWPHVTSIATSTSSILLGNSIHIDVTVRNPGSVGQSCRVRLLVDRSQTSGWDLDETHGPTTINSGGYGYFGWDYTPSNSGTYYIKPIVECYISTYVVTDDGGWASNFSVVEPVGNLQVYVKDYNGSYRSYADVFRYSSSWSYIDQDDTNTSGYAYWSGIDAATYNLEAYYTDNGTREFWGSGQATVSIGNTASTTIQRTWPYAYATSNSTPSVIIGNNAHMDVDVKNPGSTSRSCRVRLLADRNKAAPWDLDETHGPSTVSGGGHVYFGWDYTPPATGTYYIKPIVECYSNSSWVVTDDGGWADDFTVIPRTGNLQVYVRDENGDLRTGAVVWRYSSSWSYIDQQTTNPGGYVYWSGIDAATYNLEVFYTEDGTQEFWGGTAATVPIGDTQSITIQRHWPLEHDTTLSAASIILQDSIHADVTVRNPGSSAQSCRVRLLVDRNMAAPWDLDETHGPSTINSGGYGYFGWDYTPIFSGTYYLKPIVECSINSQWVVTDDAGWVENFTVIPRTGNLQVYVQDENGSYRAGALVYRYSSTWSYLDQQTTNPSGYVYWSGIDATTYNLEVYYQDNGSQEFWGGTAATVPIGDTQPVTIRRHWPYLEHISHTPDAVAVGGNAHADVDIFNPGTAGQSCQVRLLIDRSKSEPWDLDETHGPSTVPPGGFAYFGWDYTVPATGVYYLRPIVSCLVDGNWTVTDDSGWADSFSTFTISGSAPDGAVISVVQDGDIIQSATASSGSYQVSGLAAGSYQVMCSKTGRISDEAQTVALSTTTPQATANCSLPSIVDRSRSVCGWIADWAYQDGYNAFNANKSVFREISPVTYRLGANGTVDLIAGVDLSQLKTTAHNAAIAVLPTLGADYASTLVHEMLNSAGLRQAHINQIVAAVVTGGYEGIDIDYEGIELGDRAVFTQFLTALAQDLHAHGKTLSVTLQAKTVTTGGQDYAAIGAVADQARIMAYDNNWNLPIPPYYHATYAWVSDVMVFAASQIPAAKLKVALPLYGHYDTVSQATAIYWPQVQTVLDTYQIDRREGQQRDNGYPHTSFTPNFTYNDGSQHHLWYEDATSVQKKLDVVLNNNLNGVCFWRLGGEDPDVYNRLSLFLQGYAFPQVNLTAIEVLDAGGYPATEFFQGDTVTFRVRFQNAAGKAPLPVEIPLNVRGPDNATIVLNTSATGSLGSGQTAYVDIDWEIPQDAPTGPYDLASSVRGDDFFTIHAFGSGDDGIWYSDRLTVSIRPRTKISGRLFDMSAMPPQPLAGLTVQLHSEKISAVLETHTSGDGYYEFVFDDLSDVWQLACANSVCVPIDFYEKGTITVSGNNDYQTEYSVRYTREDNFDDATNPEIHQLVHIYPERYRLNDPENHQNFVLVPPLQLPLPQGINPAKTPLLLVHGLHGESGYWVGIRKQLLLSPYYLQVWEVYYPNNDDIFEGAATLRDAVEVLIASYDQDHQFVDMVAHSMGGPVTLAYIQGLGRYPYDAPAESYVPKVDRLLQLSPANHGTVIAPRLREAELSGEWPWPWNNCTAFWNNVKGLLTGDSQDPFEPALWDLSPGSDFYKQLYASIEHNGINAQDYLVVTGTDPSGAAVTGCSVGLGQNDFLISASSASMLNWGAPLGLIFMDHSEIKGHGSIPFSIDAPLPPEQAQPVVDLIGAFMQGQMTTVRQNLDIYIDPSPDPHNPRSYIVYDQDPASPHVGNWGATSWSDDPSFNTAFDRGGLWIELSDEQGNLIVSDEVWVTDGSLSYQLSLSDWGVWYLDSYGVSPDSAPEGGWGEIAPAGSFGKEYLVYIDNGVTSTPIGHVMVYPAQTNYIKMQLGTELDLTLSVGPDPTQDIDGATINILVELDGQPVSGAQVTLSDSVGQSWAGFEDGDPGTPKTTQITLVTDEHGMATTSWGLDVCLMAPLALTIQGQASKSGYISGSASKTIDVIQFIPGDLPPTGNQTIYYDVGAHQVFVDVSPVTGNLSVGETVNLQFEFGRDVNYQDLDLMNLPTIKGRGVVVLSVPEIDGLPVAEVVDSGVITEIYHPMVCQDWCTISTIEDLNRMIQIMEWFMDLGAFRKGEFIDIGVGKLPTLMVKLSSLLFGQGQGPQGYDFDPNNNTVTLDPMQWDLERFGVEAIRMTVPLRMTQPGQHIIPWYTHWQYFTHNQYVQNNAGAQSQVGFNVTGEGHELVLVNEVVTQGTVTVELYNPGDQAIDLSGWQAVFYNASGGIDRDYALPTGFQFEAGAYLRLHEGSGTNTQSDLYLDSALTWTDQNASGALAILDGSKGVDFVRFGNASMPPPDGTTWVGENPAGPGLGLSLGRDSAGSDSDHGEDWCTQNPTLGSRNAGCGAVCYPLAREHSGAGDNPVASPPMSSGCPLDTYTAGEPIAMVALPDEGYHLDFWTGTNGPADHHFTMPDGPHTVRANYAQDLVVGPLVFDGARIDDDTSTSYGDGDGVVECGETIEYNLSLHNLGNGTATSITAWLSSNDPYVTLTDDEENFPDIAGGGSEEDIYDFDFEIAADTPDGHVVSFDLDTETGSGLSWSESIQVTVSCLPAMYTISGTILDGSQQSLSHVVLSGLPGNPATDENGHYTAEVSRGWAGTVTPQKLGFSFTPNQRSYSPVLFNLLNQDYTASRQFFAILLPIVSRNLNAATNQPPDEPDDIAPQDLAGDQPLDITLVWSASDPDGDDLQYDVYFGDSNPPVLVAQDHPVTSYQPGTLSPDTTYYWRIVAKDPQGAATQGPVWRFITGAGGILTNGLYSYFPLDNKDDLLGYAVTGETTPVSHTTGLLGDALQVPEDAHNAMIYFGSGITDLDNTYQSVLYEDASLNVWINIASFNSITDGTMNIISGQPHVSESEGGCQDGINHWALQIGNVPGCQYGSCPASSGTEKIVFRAGSYDANGVYQPEQSVTLPAYEGGLSANTWYMLTMIHDSSSHTWKLYVNGSLENEVTMTQGIGDGALTRACPYAIGDRPIAWEWGFPFSGRIDELGMWDRILSSTEIQALYNQGQGLSLQPGQMQELFRDDFSSDLGWIDESGGHLYRDPTNERLVYTTYRAETRRWLMPISLGAGQVEMRLRFNVASQRGNGMAWFGLVESLGAYPNLPWPAADVTGVLLGIYPNDVGMIERHADGSQQTVFFGEGIPYGGPNLWRQVTLAIEDGQITITLEDDQGNPLGQLMRSMLASHASYTYLYLGMDAIESSWETQSGYVDDIVVMGSPPP